MNAAILIAVFLQLSVDADGKPSPQVMATATAEFASKEACRNAIAGLYQLGEATGFKVNAICAPKDIAKLEVEKPKAKPQRETPQQGGGGSGSRT